MHLDWLINEGRVLERRLDLACLAQGYEVVQWVDHGPTEHWTDDEPKLYDVTPTKTQMSWDDYGRSGQATGLAVGRLFELAGYGLLFAGIGWGVAQVVKEMRR